MAKKKKEIKNIEKTLDYRELAEFVLQRFQLNKVEDLSDQEILMEFSKMSDSNAVFNSSINYPDGTLAMCRPTTKVDGIIWANKFCPEFVKVVVPDQEWMNIWMLERTKKVNTEKFVQEAFTSDKLLEKILERDKEFVEQGIKNNETMYKINLYSLFQILKEEYDQAISDGLNVVIPSPLDILNIIAEMNYFNDFSDMIAKAEQEVFNNKKISYVEYSETENIDISEIINDFDDDEDDEDENIFNDESSENKSEDEDDDIFDDDDDDIFD